MSGPQDIGRAYRLLGITRQCTDDQLNKAYRQLALRFHPDRHVDGAAETAQSKFQEISAAYEVLQEHRRTAGHAHPDPGMGSQRSDAGRSSGSGARHGSAGGGGDSGGEYTYNAYKGRSEFGYGGDPRSGEPNTWRGQHNEFGYNDSGASAGGSSRRNFQFTAEHGRGFRNPTHARAAQPMEVMYSKTELRVRSVAVVGVVFAGVYSFLSLFVWGTGRTNRSPHPGSVRSPSVTAAARSPSTVVDGDTGDVNEGASQSKRPSPTGPPRTPSQRAFASQPGGSRGGGWLQQAQNPARRASPAVTPAGATATATAVPPAVAVAGSATVVVGLASGVASSLDAESALSEPRRDDAAAGGSLTRGVEEVRERKGSTDEEEVAMTDRSQVSSEKDSSEEDELSEEERLLAAVAKAKASRVSELEQALELARAEQEAAAVAVAQGAAAAAASVAAAAAGPSPEPASEASTSKSRPRKGGRGKGKRGQRRPAESDRQGTVDGQPPMRGKSRAGTLHSNSTFKEYGSQRRLVLQPQNDWDIYGIAMQRNNKHSSYRQGMPNAASHAREKAARAAYNDERA